MIMKVKGIEPKISESTFVHKSAVVTGDVTLAENTSVWPCAAIRGDMNAVVIGKNSNVQDNSVLHTLSDVPLVIGENVVVGHNVNLHSCQIGDNCIVGIGSIVLDNAKIGKNSIVAAGSLVPPGKEFPDGVLIMGSPAKVARDLNEQEIAMQKDLVAHYIQEAKDYMQTEEEI